MSTKNSELLTPDLTFYMDISAKKSKERISEREMDRMESEPLEFFEKVRQGYLEIAKKILTESYVLMLIKV